MCLRLFLLLWLSTVSVLGFGSHWEHRQRTPAGSALQSVAWTGSLFVAVGEHGTVLTSPAGTSWAAQASGTRLTLRSVVWTGARLVAVGDEGGIVTSTNGSVWTPVNGLLRLALRGIAWTGTQCVAVGDGGTVLTSPDGLAWTPRASGTFASLQSVFATSTLIVAVGDQGTIVTSTNGTTWATSAAVSAQRLNAVGRSGSRWVAAGDGGTLLSSANGTSWAAQSSGLTVDLLALHWDGTRFVSAGADGASVHSSDGLAWTTSSTGSGIEFRGLASGNGTVVAVGDHGGIATTLNAISWNNRSSGSTAFFHDVVRTGSQWIAVGEAGLVMRSSNGSTWTTATSGTTATLNGVAWSGSTLVAVGDGGVVITSSDGSAWTPRTSGTTNALLSVAWTGSQFVAVGARGAIRVSSAGTSWAAGTSGTTRHLRAVAAASATQIAAVGDNGLILSSTNGTSWTARTSGVNTDLNGIASNGSLFVTAGAKGQILTSSNLSTWAPAVSPVAGTEADSFHTVRWMDSTFVAVGHLDDGRKAGGVTVQSTNGTSWTVLDTVASPPLSAAAATDDQALLAGAGGTMLTDAALVIPQVQFQVSAASISESGGQQVVTVTASEAPSGPVTIPFTVGGTATVATNGDATLPAGFFTIEAGQTTGSMAVTIRQDTMDEPDETVVLTLQPLAGAVLGVLTQFTLTIVDDDTAPVISPGPPGEMVPAGMRVEMGFEVSGGGPISYQWLKNGTSIPGATAPQYIIPSAALSSAGTYKLRITAAAVTAESQPYELAVVDLAGSAVTLVYGKTASFSINAVGSGLSYQWQRDGIDLPDEARITGSTSSKVTIASLTGVDEGTYRCVVSSTYGGLEGGSHVLTVTVPPVVGVPVVGPLMVSQPVVIPVLSGNDPARFVITGLPSGLGYNTTTGEISGRPQVPSGAQPFQIVIKASNAAGTSTPVSFPLTVLPLPAGTVGSFLGTVDRQSGLSPTSSLGGRISVATTANGRATCTLVLGAASHPFVQPLDAAVGTDPVCTAVIVRKGMTPLTVTFTLQSAAGLLTGTVTDGVQTAALRAWAAMSVPFTAYTGYYTSAWRLANAGDAGVQSIPQGSGYAFFTVNASGTASGTIRLSDGTQIPVSAALRNNGGLVLFSPLYGTTGSLLGTLNLAAGAPVLVQTSGLNWMKQPQSVATRSYKAGFGPVSLAVSGARYTAPPSGGIVMQLSSTADNVPNAALEFAEGGVPDPAARLNVQLRYTAPAVRDPQTPAVNPGKVSVILNASTGVITGSFVLVDNDPTTGRPLERKPLLYGLVARDMDGVLRGFGHFQLPRLPDNYVVPPTTSTTSPALSGRLLLRPLP